MLYIPYDCEWQMPCTPAMILSIILYQFGLSFVGSEVYRLEIIPDENGISQAFDLMSGAHMHFVEACKQDCGRQEKACEVLKMQFSQATQRFARENSCFVRSLPCGPRSAGIHV